MANYTSNYNLKKPLPEEFYNIEDHNGNMDIIDEELKKRATLEDGKVPASQLPSMDYVPTSEKGAAGGVATLGSDGKIPSSQMPSTGDYVPTSRKVNGKALSSDITLSASDVSAVPTSRTVNGKALSSDITLSASDVGLGNVPNVTTNNQTPTYSQASSLANISSGEKLSTSFGKIMKAIADLISHLSNKSNPHAVTASQAGAVPANEDIVIQKNGVAYDSIFGQGTRNALLRVRNVAGNASNQRTIALFDSTQRPDLETAVRLYDVVDGTETIYSLFGEHNLEKLATALGAARIQTGSYVGTGAVGSTNPCSLTFNFKPKLLFVLASNASHAHDTTSMGIMVWAGQNGIEKQGSAFTFNESTNTLSWYTSNTVENNKYKLQSNVSGMTYRWIAFY